MAPISAVASAAVSSASFVPGIDSCGGVPRWCGGSCFASAVWASSVLHFSGSSGPPVAMRMPRTSSPAAKASPARCSRTWRLAASRWGRREAMAAADGGCRARGSDGGLRKQGRRGGRRGGPMRAAGRMWEMEVCWRKRPPDAGGDSSIQPGTPTRCTTQPSRADRPSGRLTASPPGRGSVADGLTSGRDGRSRHGARVRSARVTPAPVSTRQSTESTRADVSARAKAQNQRMLTYVPAPDETLGLERNEISRPLQLSHAVVHGCEVGAMPPPKILGHQATPPPTTSNHILAGTAGYHLLV